MADHPDERRRTHGILKSTSLPNETCRHWSDLQPRQECPASAASIHLHGNRLYESWKEMHSAENCLVPSGQRRCFSRLQIHSAEQSGLCLCNVAKRTCYKQRERRNAVAMA